MNIQEFVIKAKKGEIDIVDNTIKFLDKTKEINSKNKYLNAFAEDAAKLQVKNISKIQEKGLLYGFPMTVKDCICVKGVESTAGSKILKGYNPLFNATSVQKLLDEGAIVFGKNSQDEFGFGSFNTNVGVNFDIPLNPHDESRVCGGSSGGSAGFVAKMDMPNFSLAESTGGSIVAPASFCGNVGMCPTYGRVSRYGLMDYANSLDKIGPITKTVEDNALILDIISGYDPKDSTSVRGLKTDFQSYLGKDIKDLKIAIISDFFGDGTDQKVADTVLNKLKGINYDKVTLPLNNKIALETYYIIAMCEASTNLAKYCGMRYGKHEKLEGTFNEYFTKVRSDSFGAEAKRRIIIGTFARMAGYRDAYYIKAMKVRTKLIEEYKKIFSKYDLIISPTMPVIAPKFDEIKKLTPMQNYMMDIMTVGPNLSGMPHMTINAGSVDGMPVGLMIIADHFNEGKIYQLGSYLENKK